MRERPKNQLKTQTMVLGIGGQAKRGSKKGEGERRNECLPCTHGS